MCTHTLQYQASHRSRRATVPPHCEREQSVTSPSSPLREFTLRGLLLGALITVVFTAANVYLGLKVGLTFASAIPAAVLSMALLHRMAGANILENNIVQTQASAAGTLSSVIFILPGLLMVGHWAGFPFWQTAIVCAAGGVLGVLYTIPLRRVMVVQSTLPYPEGVAAAEVLRAGHAGSVGGSLRNLLGGGLVAALFALASSGFKWLGEGFNVWFASGNAVFRVATGFSPALIAAGYLMGAAGGVAILFGLVVCWGVLVPWLTAQHTLAAGQTIAQLGSAQWASQARFVGAGVIGVAAIWTVLSLLRPIVRGLRQSMHDQRAAAAVRGNAERPETDRDMSAPWIFGLAGLVFVVVLLLIRHFVLLAEPTMASNAIWWFSAVCALFAFVFGFLIAAACGYMAGLVGSSSSPISGIGIIAVILVSLLILVMRQFLPDALGEGHTQLAIALALFTTAVIIAVAAISNDNLQDLKTGYLVGATPWRQQVALLVGCVVGALVIPPVLELLYQGYGFLGAVPRADMDPSKALAAPQATLLTAVATGIFQGTLNWTMLSIGAALGVLVIVVDLLLRRGGTHSLPPLAVGLGIYLPPTVGMTLFLGAMLGHAIHRVLERRLANQPASALEDAKRQGVLLVSGLIVGESLMGIVMAALIGITGDDTVIALVGPGFAPTAQWLGLLAFLGVVFWIWRRVTAGTPAGVATPRG
jgi:putative OPT family oligopeptide transporter